VERNTIVRKTRTFFALHRWGDNWPHSQSRSTGDNSKLINLAASRIKIYYFGCQISTFCQANTLKTDCIVHGIAKRETAGLVLWFQRKILWVNALFVCKFDPFPKNVWSSNQPKFPTSSSIYYTVEHWIFKIRSNDLNSSLNSPGWEKITPLSVQESLLCELHIHWTNLTK